MSPSLEVLEPGPGATVQDLGRIGLGSLGVPQAGAADPDSLRLANRLVGNPESAAAIEILLGGLEAVVSHDTVFALAGAPCPVHLDRRPVPGHTRAFARAGQTIRLGTTDQGLRAYLAVAGGFDVPPVLGSRSTDTLSGIGPPPLRRGSVLPIGAPSSSARSPALSSGAPAAPDVVVQRTMSRGRLTVTARPGPRADLFPAAALTALAAGPWLIDQDTDRTAARLQGPALYAEGAGQLPTEGLALGSIQVPPSGQPIIHLANHPPTGGYPVIAVVDRDDVARIAQAPPGTPLVIALAPAPEFVPPRSG